MLLTRTWLWRCRRFVPAMPQRVLLLCVVGAVAAGAVWPPPRTIVATGDPVALSPSFVFDASAATLQSSLRLARMIKRYNLLVAPPHTTATRAAAAAAGEGTVHSLAIAVSDLSEALGMDTPEGGVTPN